MDHEWIRWAAGVGAAVLGWLGIRTVRRLDEKADHAALQNLIRDFHEHAQETRNSIAKVHEKQDRTISQINSVSDRVSHVEGQLERLNGKNGQS